jgi:hypothetical protein
MTDIEKLNFGIEIIAAMKASVYNETIEVGRILALEGTEVDRIENITPEYWNSLSKKNKDILTLSASLEKERLYKQAIFVVDIALKFLEQSSLNTSHP